MGTESKPIDLIDTSKFVFGSKEWRDAMFHNINSKITYTIETGYKEELSPAELSFLHVEKTEEECRLHKRL